MLLRSFTIQKKERADLASLLAKSWYFFFKDVRNAHQAAAQASQEASSAMLTVCGLDGVKTKRERTDLASLLAKSWYF